MQPVILDSTLREGELYKIFPVNVKLGIAKGLIDVGVVRVELTVDYPGRTSEEDIKPVVELLKEHNVLPVLHGRATAEDVEAIAKYGEVGCALYMSLSSLHLEYKLRNLTLEEAVEKMCRSISKASEYSFPYIRATVEDASRIFLEQRKQGVDLIGEFTEKFKEAGATLVSIPDTSGLLTPSQAHELVKEVKQVSKLPIAAHFHNDYGMASANTVEAALAGAEELHVTIMGIGDRNGIADLYEVAASLQDLHGVNLGIRREKLAELYRGFSKMTGIRLFWRSPLSEEARTIRAGVHQSMTVKKPEGYIPVGKLKYDFNEPLYELNPYISHKLIQTLLDNKINDKEELKLITSKIASVIRNRNQRPNLQVIKELISRETGFDIPLSRLEQFFGVDKVYILLKLNPSFSTENLKKHLLQDPDVEGFDEVYGDADMIIIGKLRRSEENNLVSRIRRAFGPYIEDMHILVAD